MRLAEFASRRRMTVEKLRASPWFGGLVDSGRFIYNGEDIWPNNRSNGRHRRLLTLDEVAAELHCSLATVKRQPLPRFHDARHVVASHALAAGLSAHAVAALLGHSHAGLVWRRYGHARPDEIAEAGEPLGAWRITRAEALAG